MLDPTQDGFWDSTAGCYLGVTPREFRNLFELDRDAHLHLYLPPA